MNEENRKAKETNVEMGFLFKTLYVRVIMVNIEMAEKVNEC